MINRRTFLTWVAASTLAATGHQGCSRLNPVAQETPVPSSTLPKQTGTPTSSTGQNLRVAFPGAPKQLDPAMYTVIEEYQIGFALFDSLVWVDQTLTPQPMLAESWESNTTLHSWTFKLREDVKFHHGTAFTAQDVIYTFERILDPKVGSPFRSSLSFLDKIEAADEYTVRFRLKSPSAELPLLLGAPQARIVPHDLSGAVLAVKPMGTGPFQFGAHIVGERTKLLRNPTYWQSGQPLLETIEFIFMPYEQQVSALRNETIHLLMQLGIAEIDALIADPAITVNEVASGAYQNIVMRATAKPFENLYVRAALKACVDRPTMQAKVLQGRGALGNDHPVTALSPFWADLPEAPYDPDQARALLARAGYKKGLTLDLLTSTVRPGMEEMAHAFKAMAKAAGIDIRVIRAPAPVYWSDYAGRVPFHIGNWGFRPSIDETFMVAYHSLAKGNESNWRNPELDTLIDNARGERDNAQRKALYQQAQQLLMEKGAVIIPYFRPALMAMRNTIQGFTPHPSGWLDFRTTRLAL